MADAAFDFVSAQLRTASGGRRASGPRRKRVADIYVDGLDEVIVRATLQSDKMRNRLRTQIRRIARPIVNDAKSRFEALGGTGPRVAKTVRLRFDAVGVGLSVGNQATPFVKGREFGAKRNWTRRHIATVGWAPNRVRMVVARNMHYSGPKQFGTWTGNQFDLGLTGERMALTQVSGRAFYPSIADGIDKLDTQLKALIDRQLAELREA